MLDVTAPRPTISQDDALAGCLLGTAVGDALGLPYEGLSANRAAKLYGPPGCFRLLFGRGMVSDDTEHACIVAQCLIESASDETVFARSLAKRLRWWLLGLPAGTGRATLRACVRLWLGMSPSRSGVYSAGNGPAMRATILGAAVQDLDKLRALNRISTRITHTDPRAEAGAFVIALAARFARNGSSPDGHRFLSLVQSALGPQQDRQLIERLELAIESVERCQSTVDFVTAIGLNRGVSGFINDTVPAVIHAWLSHPTDLRIATIEIIRCGGDADSTAALVGGIIGAGVGSGGVPPDWLERLAEWPRSVNWMKRLSRELDRTFAKGTASTPSSLPAMPLLLRNVMFLIIVLLHGFYRLRPW